MPVIKKLLIVEDDPKSLYAFRTVLQTREFQVVACDSAEAALTLSPVSFDTAIIDVRLPKMQGPDLAQRLLLTRPDLRVIFVTAYDGIDHIRKTVPSCSILLKPIDMDQLIRLL